MKAWFEQVPVYAWALAAYPLLHIAGTNPGQASATALTLALGASLVATTILVLFGRWVGGNDWRWGGLWAVAPILLFYAYGSVYQWAETRVLDSMEGGGKPEYQLAHLHAYLSTGAILLIAVWTVIARYGRRKNLGRFTLAANAVLMALVLMSGTRVLWNEIGRGSAKHDPALTASTPRMPRDNSPDIYYIILDGYARADVLATRYGYDNSAFIEQLQKRGFDVAARSNSNYYWTFLSLASSLNMDYLDKVIGPGIDPATRDRSLPYRLIQDNAAATFLRARGYRYHHMQSTWGATRNNPAADAQFGCRRSVFSDEFFQTLVDATWLRVFEESASMGLAECHQSNFRLLGQMGGVEGPKFVFAHFLLPHHPYLFDENGNVQREATLSNQFELQKALWEKKDAYLSQLKFVNASLIAVLDELDRDSTVPPVIIIQSDHGPNLTRDLSISERFSIRFANFVASRTPAGTPGPFGETITPVNEFRALFNQLFGSTFPLLPDRHFVSSFGMPFQLCEVEGVGEGKITFDVESAGCGFLANKRAALH